MWDDALHDCGPRRLHIPALLLDLFYGVQGKFLRFFEEVERVVLNALATLRLCRLIFLPSMTN
jgi:hypothetical protein